MTTPPSSHATAAAPQAPLLRISPANRPVRPVLAKPVTTSSCHADVHSPTSPTSPASTPTVNDRCVYRATECTNPRALKATGERHKFCQFHLRQTSVSQRAQCQRKQSKTLLFRDPSRVPAALLRQVPQTKLAAAHAPLLPRLRSHDVLRRALLADTQRLPLPATSTAVPLTHTFGYW